MQVMYEKDMFRGYSFLREQDRFFHPETGRANFDAGTVHFLIDF